MQLSFQTLGYKTEKQRSLSLHTHTWCSSLSNTVNLTAVCGTDCSSCYFKSKGCKMHYPNNNSKWKINYLRHCTSGWDSWLLVKTDYTYAGHESVLHQNKAASLEYISHFHIASYLQCECKSLSDCIQTCFRWTNWGAGDRGLTLLCRLKTFQLVLHFKY